MLVRLIAASLVIYGHSFAFSTDDGTPEFFSHYLGYRYAGDVGVNIFFVVSGFLITASFCHRQNIRAFLTSRAIRIYPALFAFVAITALVFGPLFTRLSPGDYFGSATFWTFIFNNLTMVNYYGDLPVEFTGSQFPNSVAGVLWTIVIEIRLYILIAMIGVLGLLRYRVAATVVLLMVLLIPVTYGLNRFLIFSNWEHARLTALFCIGALLYVNRAAVPLHPVIFAVLALATALSNGAVYTHMFTASLVYGVFCFAFAPKIDMPVWLQDYSYGIYLYGWIVQQLVHYQFPELGPIAAFGLSLPLATACGALSWYIVEKPALALKKKGVKANANATEGAQPLSP
ncbi:acyltransferase family protein [Brucella anthropi]|nr:acyltransferase [Brucella anthropi]